MWLAALGVAMMLFTGAGPARPKYETVTKTGKVVTLPSALKTLGVPADPEPIASQVVLLEEDGTITPLLSDEASRGLFRDERLRDRKAELTGRKYPGLPYLQVTTFKVDDHGVLRIPEYYCDVCAISVRYPQVCPCCQGPMELRMKSDGR
jgi:hypothetical protein